MRILVTGDKGYIGVVLVPMLQARGHEVVGIDSNLYRGCTIGPAATNWKSQTLDVRDVTPNHLRGFDAVCHLAAISNDPVGDLNPETTYEINYRATVALARAAVEAGVSRFVFSSSCSLYGAAGDAPLDETASFNPVTPYGESKIMAEQEIAPMATPGFTPVFLRNATAYGFSSSLRGDLVVNNLVGYALTTGEVFLKSDGTPWRPLVHIEDISRAFCAAVEAPAEVVSGQAFNVGLTSENYRVREVAEMVERAVPGSRIAFADSAGPDKRNYRVSCDRIARELPGFHPQWTVERGVRELYDAYRRHGLTLEDLTGPRLQRIARVKELQAAGALGSDLRLECSPCDGGGGGMSDVPPCRSCGAEGVRPFLSLGETPLADALVSPANARQPEARFPLTVAFCPNCTLVQILESVPPGVLFVNDYPYYSSFSDAVLDHSRRHAENLISARDLNSESLVVEVASNDGYLLRNFVEAGIPVLGIDPAPDQAAAASAVRVPTIVDFFGIDLARKLTREGKRADVIIANNVMAHVPDLNGFVAGLRELLTDDGLVTVENPYVRDLIDHREFDTIYHEHHCYFSCTAIDRLVRRHGLFLNDVEYFPNLHGGTLRWHLGAREAVSERARAYLEAEEANGLTRFGYYDGFARHVEGIKAELLELLGGLKRQGKSIAAYGAAAKGSTLLNYTGIGTDLIDFVVDRNHHKVGKLMPGVHIPIRGVDALLTGQPDYVLMLAWNFKDEIMRQQAEYASRGGQFIVPVPRPEIVAPQPVGVA